MYVLTKPFQEGKEILKKIENSNHQAFFVGGCVRDLLLERPIGDIDIATSAPPDLIQKIFTKVIPVGIEHGTVIVLYQNKSYEVTTFRLDGTYTDHRHPDTVRFIDKIDQDLQRRDFTINALAMDKDGIIIDSFNGKKDLKDQVIRAVGNGYERFLEDPLRMIRAIRFSSQLGFVIENETLSNIKELKQHIDTIAIERITNEFTKMFSGDYLNNGMNYIIRTNLYKHLPIMSKYPDIVHKLPKSLKPFHSFGEVLALFHCLEQRISIFDWIKAWKCSNKIKHEAIQLSDALKYYHNNGLDPWLVYNLQSPYFNGFIRLVHTILPHKAVTLKCLKQINDDLPIRSKRDLALGGNDLINLFPQVKKGAWMNQLITKMEKEVVLNKIPNTKSNLKEWIKCNPPEIN